MNARPAGFLRFAIFLAATASAPSSAGFGTMKSRLAALLFALFLCHEACADCFVSFLEGVREDTLCIKDSAAYHHSWSGGRRFGKARKQGDVLLVTHDSSAYYGPISPADTLFFSRSKDTLVLDSRHFFRFGRMFKTEPRHSYVRIGGADMPVPFLKDDGEFKALGRCGTPKRKKNLRLQDLCPKSHICCYASNRRYDDVIDERDSLCFKDGLLRKYTTENREYTWGYVRQKNGFWVAITDSSCNFGAIIPPDTTFFLQSGDTLLRDCQINPTLRRGDKNSVNNFYIRVDVANPRWEIPWECTEHHLK